ncbi:hypothetical protein [Georgenia sunbinii]|uniref:hypothetical protein n=1 Tax=Georgenia sunbinii TaxID=3117728 RepID=UPI002F266395
MLLGSCGQDAPTQVDQIPPASIASTFIELIASEELDEACALVLTEASSRNDEGVSTGGDEDCLALAGRTHDAWTSDGVLSSAEALTTEDFDVIEESTGRWRVTAGPRSEPEELRIDLVVVDASGWWRIDASSFWEQ